MAGAGLAGRRVRIWDAPVRLIHWSFVLLLPALWWTWKSGDMDLHRKLGYAMLALVLFRIFWGVAGGATARFSGFVRGPGTVAGYLRGLFSKSAEPIVGHNPLGGWSVVTLLLLLGVQVGLGLIAQDIDGIESGPLAHYVSYETSDAAREWHETIFNVLLGVIALHVGAILFYLAVKRDNLVGPMVTGRRHLPHHVAEPAAAPWWRILVGIALVAPLTWWITAGAPLP